MTTYSPSLTAELLKLAEAATPRAYLCSEEEGRDNVPLYALYPSAFADQLRAADEEVARQQARITTLFDAIKHGDEKHQQWLREKIDEHFAPPSEKSE